ncbi:DoxX-like family protein [Piscinibacter sakaiensis]
MQALARLALAAVWWASAAVSFGLYPVELGAALLGEAGVPGPLQRPMLYGAATLDAVLGVLTLAPLAMRLQRRLWAAQALLVVFYSAVVTVTMPAFWLHPFGPMTKNLPILALLALLAWAAVPPRPWTTSSSSGSTC